jgi:BMFP domain-containing protein YqiC
MQIVTSWMRTGIEQGRREGEVSIVMRLLKRKVGELNPEIETKVRELSETQLEALSEALLDFTSINSLVYWFDRHNDRGLISIILRQLQRKVGELEPEVEAQVRELQVAQLEELSEALLDFEDIEDLTDWLRNLAGES